MTTAIPSSIFDGGFATAKVLLFLFLLFSHPLQAAETIRISNVTAEKSAPDHYVLKAEAANPSAMTKEVVFRAQISFYDRSSPEGDKPAAVIRKDFMAILKAGESRDLEITIINEGSPLMGAVRAEPMLRIRRQREWNY